MSDVWEAIVKVSMSVHPDRVLAAADRLMKLPTDQHHLPGNLLGVSVNNDILSDLNRAWCESKLTASELASALRGAVKCCMAVRSEQAVDLVWTGPSSKFVSPRHTEQALLEIIAQSTKSLFIVSFVAYQVKAVYAELAKAAKRGVDVSILLEPSKQQGGMPDHDSVRLMKSELPTASFYTWANADGAVHAKCAVADQNHALITSANLTSAAMDRNMELGVLVKGGDLPKTLSEHLNALVSTGVNIPL